MLCTVCGAVEFRVLSSTEQNTEEDFERELAKLCKNRLGIIRVLVSFLQLYIQTKEWDTSQMKEKHLSLANAEYILIRIFRLDLNMELKTYCTYLQRMSKCLLG